MAAERFVPGAKAWVIAVGVAAGAGILCQSTAWGQGRMGGQGPRNPESRHAAAADSTPAYTPLPTQDGPTPHGGEYVSSETNYYEIVYMPLQTRVYLFDNNVKPLTARDVHAQMTLQLPKENVPRQVPFQYVAMPPGSPEQDYVMARFDIRPLQDKETSITLEFSGLSGRTATATFSPYYPRFSSRPYVSKVLVTDADRDGVARQRVCPVSGAVLGSRGPVVKLYLGDYPLYVAADNCIAAVKEAPQKFLPRPPAPSPAR